MICDLAVTNSCLGDKMTAVALTERAQAAVPVEKNPQEGPLPIEILARVAARTGDADRAIAALQKLISTPYLAAWTSGVPLTPALLQLDPTFDPLRADPRFKELVETRRVTAPH